MASSTLKFYQCEITPEKNCAVDNIEDYLNNLDSYNVENFQYQKIEVDKEIKINFPQKDLPKFPYNYISIINSDSTKVYYYFIIGIPEWTSQNTVRLSISLDSINTFRSELIWTKKTNITREHKDRFNQKKISSGTNKLIRKIDRFDEGISPVKYLKKSTTIRKSLFDYDFFLIYKNRILNTDETSANKVIDCFCCASKEIPLYTSSSSVNQINFLDYNIGDSLYVFSSDNVTFSTTIKGTRYTIGENLTYKGIAFVRRSFANVAYLMKESDSELISDIGNTALSNVSSSVFVKVCTGFDPGTTTTTYNYYSIYGKVETRNHTTIEVGSTNRKLLSFDTINRTETNIIKIIKMPYSPFIINTVDGKMKIPDGWSYSGGYLILKNLDNEFLTYVDDIDISDKMILKVQSADIGLNRENDIKYESKLYNSNFFSLKYFYDNFEKEIFLERYSTTLEIPHISIAFKQSNNISSNSLFRFSALNGTYEEPQLYGEYLNVNRQNEVSLYNSEYLNYIRTGYNYDKKAKEKAAITSGVSLAGTLAGAITSFALSPFTGGISAAAGISLASSSLSSITNHITGIISSERNIEQKLEQYKMSPASVSSTEDLNLLSYYNGNRLIETEDSIDDSIKNQIYNLFRLTGYSCDYYGIPNVSSRLYYNFLKCSPEFEEFNWNYGKDILDDIKTKYEIGVTYFHRVNGTYDWSQEKENFESWMINS